MRDRQQRPEARGSDPLARADWSYIDKPCLEQFRADDWRLLEAQRAVFYAEHQAEQILSMLSQGRDLPSFGYRINNYRHCLQSATMAERAGHDEETVVVALLHDIGFITCPESHGPFAAMLLGSYISERNLWMLMHHQLFQQMHLHDCPGVDRNARERWRGHPHFAWAAEFVERFDQAAIDPAYDTAPLDHFAPAVRRLFARRPRPFGGLPRGEGGSI